MTPPRNDMPTPHSPSTDVRIEGGCTIECVKQALHLRHVPERRRGACHPLEAHGFHLQRQSDGGLRCVLHRGGPTHGRRVSTRACWI